jgi:hypothetical protein
MRLLLLTSLLFALPAAASPQAALRLFEVQCVRPLAEGRCVMTEADGAGLTYTTPPFQIGGGTMAWAGPAPGVTMVFSSTRSHQCRVVARGLTREDAEKALETMNPGRIVTLRTESHIAGQVLVAEVPEDFATPMPQAPIRP